MAPGGAQTFTISDLQGGTTYYFAVKSADAGDNWSDLSNIATVPTTGDGNESSGCRNRLWRSLTSGPAG